MKAKTKKQAQLIMIYAIVVMFVASSFLLFLPMTPTPQPTGPPALNELPEAFGQQNAVPPDQAAAPPADGAVQPNPAVPGAETQANPLQAAPAP